MSAAHATFSQIAHCLWAGITSLVQDNLTRVPMKTFSHSFRRRLWRSLLLGLCAASGPVLLAQFTVTVPAGCTVVQAGSGGGGNQVGAGGTVCMPDPFDIPGAGGNFTWNGGGIIKWTGTGDLSHQTAAVPPALPTVSVGAVVTTNIESYNTGYRPGTYEASNPSRARSKGRVRVDYIDGVCNKFIEFDVLKTWTTPNPAIIGPACWAPSQQYVYAVDIASGDNVNANIGFDQYYWEAYAANGNQIMIPTNNSAESSSIVLLTPSTLLTDVANFPQPWTLKCCFGRCNPWDGTLADFPTHAVMNARTSCVSMPILSTSSSPALTLPLCLATNATTATFSFTNNGNTHTWSVFPNSWSVSSTATSVTVAAPAGDQNPGVLAVVSANGSCQSVSTTFIVNRTFASTLLTASSTCVNPGASFTANLPGTAQGNSTGWTLPAGWTFVNNNPAQSSRTITVPLGTLPGSYTITAFSTSCPGNSSLTICVKPAVPVFTAGPTCLNSGSTAPIVYTVSVPAGGPYTYSWNIPAGWSGSSTSNTITVTPNGTNVGTVSCTICSCTSCCTTNTRTVGFNPIMPVVTFPQCYNVGVAGMAAFAVANVQSGSTYTWAFAPLFSPSAVSTAPNGVSTVRNTAGTARGPYACSVTNTTPGCGAVVFNFTVTLTNPYTATATVVPNGPCAGSLYSVVSVNAGPAGSTYQLWNCSTSAAAGSGTTSYQLNSGGAGSFTINVTIPAAQGCCTYRPPCVATCDNAPMAPPRAPVMDGAADGLLNDQVIKLLPNPNNGTFTLRIDRSFTNGQVALYDAKGAAVGPMQQVSQGNNELGNAQLLPGAYTLQLELDGQITNKTFVVSDK